jgi:hypothetical protein
MLDLYTITKLINRWIVQMTKGNWPTKKVKLPTHTILATINALLPQSRGDSKNSEIARNKLNDFDYHALALEILLAPLPPSEQYFEELKYVLFRAYVVVDAESKCHVPGFGIDGEAIHGLTFLREVVGRLEIFYNTPANLLNHYNNAADALLKDLCVRPCGLTETYQGWLDAWRTTGIWQQTCKALIYQEHQTKVFGKTFDSLVDLSKANVEGLELEIANMKPSRQEDPFDEVESLILDRFMQGPLYFKHATFSADVIVCSGIMLCPELSTSEGVSERNAKYEHNKYVFGRLEFDDKWWETRFGDQRILFDIALLGESISISLHDQEQPFSGVNKKEEIPGHTQLIREQKTGVILRRIQGDEKQQAWTQQYNVVPSEASSPSEHKATLYPNSFVQEVFVGQSECRRGMALTLIRELRRMRGKDDTHTKQHVNAVGELKKTIAGVLKGEDHKGFQNIFKQFCRVEIRVPAYIDLFALKQAKCMIKAKNATLIEFPEYRPPLFSHLECSIAHQIIVECHTCIALVRHLKLNSLFGLAQPLLDAVCKRFLRNQPWTYAPNLPKKVREGQECVIEQIQLIVALMGDLHTPQGRAECLCCGTVAPFTQSMFDAAKPGQCTKQGCNKWTVLRWSEWGPVISNCLAAAKSLDDELKKLCDMYK